MFDLQFGPFRVLTPNLLLADTSVESAYFEREQHPLLARHERLHEPSTTFVGRIVNCHSRMLALLLSDF